MHIILSLDCGGAEKFVVELSKALNDSGKFSSSICCLKRAGDFAEEASAAGIKVIDLHKKEGLDFSLVYKIAGLIKKDRADIIHTHNMAPLLYGTAAAQISRRTAVINTRHGRMNKSAPGLIWKLNDYVAAISRDAAAEIVKYNRIDPGKLRVIHNGVDTAIPEYAEDPEAIRRGLGLGSSDIVIGTAGRLSAEKNHRSLIDALQIIEKDHLNASLIIVGDGREMSPLKKYAAENAPGARVHFTGYRQNLRDYLAAMDIFILPSWTEGLSLTLLEAMREGLPVVASDVGGNREVVVDGVTGYLVPAGNPGAIAAAACKIIGNPDFSEAMGSAGRSRVIKDFSLRSMTEKYISLYESALTEKNHIREYAGC